MPINRKVMIRPLVLTGDKLKIGLDSSVLLDLILNVESKLYFHNKISLFRKKSTFFTHINCYNESINTLIKKYNYTNEKAKEEVDDLIKEYNISKIHITEKILELADHILGMCKDKGLHETDSIILAGCQKPPIIDGWHDFISGK